MSVTTIINLNFFFGEVFVCFLISHFLKMLLLFQVFKQKKEKFQLRLQYINKVIKLFFSFLLFSHLITHWSACVRKYKTAS
jgi:hypothetical protein